MEFDLNSLFIICPLVFLGGFLDAVAGGGGLITLPAYIFAGVPTILAYGTNKFANASGTVVAAWKFYKSGHTNMRDSIIASLGALLGSAFGASLAMNIDEKYLKLCMMFVLPAVALYLALKPNFGNEPIKKEMSIIKRNALCIIIGIGIGLYDGFIGPGTGTFLIIAFTGVLGCSMLEASANAKIVNLSSNVAALIMYAFHGKIILWIGIPAAICAIIGNYIGARLAIKKGAKFIRILMFIAVGLLMAKMGYDFFF